MAKGPTAVAVGALAELKLHIYVTQFLTFHVQPQTKSRRLLYYKITEWACKRTTYLHHGTRLFLHELLGDRLLSSF